MPLVDLSCADCGKKMSSKAGSLPQGQARCHTCRRGRPVYGPKPAPKPSRRVNWHLSCNECGANMHKSAASRPQGEATCRACRQTGAGPAHRVRTGRLNGGPCAFDSCDKIATSRGLCGGHYAQSRLGQELTPLGARGANVVRNLSDPRANRYAREDSAPGISRLTRRALLAKWIKARTPCAYCPSMADTIDHVIPLVRGGTQYEGNLTPACRLCNGRKGGRMIIEWRTNKRLPPMTEVLPWAYPTARIITPKKLKVERMPHPCRVCDAITMRPIYCSGECGIEGNRRDQRDAYRKRVGTPIQWEPSKQWTIQRVTVA